MAGLSLALIAPGRARAETIQQVPWSISASSGPATFDTPRYRTGARAKTCVRTTSLSSATWRFKLVWYDGGRNKVLYRSATYTGRTTHCSPTETIGRPPHNRRHVIFTVITVIGTSPGQGSASGLVADYMNCPVRC